MGASAARAAGPADGPTAYTDGSDWSEVDADGSNAHTVTPSGGGFDAAYGVRDVAFSRDGSWAAFGSGHAIWVSWANGTHARRLTTPPALTSAAGNTLDLKPVWSPDSKTIVSADRTRCRTARSRRPASRLEAPGGSTRAEY